MSDSSPALEELYASFANLNMEGGWHRRFPALWPEPRENFVPEEKRAVAYVGDHVDLGNGPGFHFEIESFAKHCLIEGTDPLGFLLSHGDDITAYEARSA